MRYLMQTTPQRRQGRESSGPESLLEVNGRSRKSKSRCSRSEAKRRVKITSRFRHGGLRLVRFVLQSSSIYSPFFMARFGKRELCACFSRCSFAFPVAFRISMFITRERVLLCGCTLWRHRESFRSAYGLLERLSSFFVVLLTCRFARVYVYCRLQKPWKTWNRAKPARRFCLRLAHVQINPRADYFNSFNNMLFILSALCYLFRRQTGFCVSCHVTHLHVWLAFAVM